MTSRTTLVRLELRRRLASLSLENKRASEIQAVLNPKTAGDKKHIPEKGRYAVMWTEDAEALDARLDSLQWHQKWLIDVPVKWDGEDEAILDEIKVELAAVLASKIEGVKKQTLSSLKVSYPVNGSGSAVVSVDVETEYFEKIEPLV